MNAHLSDGHKTLAWGLLWVAAAVAFWLNVAGHPVNDLRLLLSAHTAPGRITDTSEDVQDRDGGGVNWYHSVVYTFTLPDGREVNSGSSGDGRLRPELATLNQPVPVEVEYLSTSPSINRLKGDGSQTLTEWLLRKAALGGFLLVLFAAPGVELIRSGLTEIHSAR